MSTSLLPGCTDGSPAAHGKFGSGWTGPYLVIQRLTDLLYRIQASKRARSKVVHVDHLERYYFEDGKEPASWLVPGTGAAEHLRAQTEEGQGTSSHSGEAETPGEFQTLDNEEFDDQQDPEIDPEENSQAIESKEDKKVPYRHSHHQIRAPDRLNLRLKWGPLIVFN